MSGGAEYTFVPWVREGYRPESDDGDGSVSVSFLANGSRSTVTMQPNDVTSVSPVSEVYRATLSSGSDHGWRNNEPPITFDVRATRSDGQEALSAVGPVTLFTGNAGGGGCS